MFHRLLPGRPSPALVVAFAALMVALGGSSFAAPVRDAAAKAITGKQIKKNAITGAHVKDGSLTAKDLKAGTLSAAGAQGERGPAGPAGPAGAAGPAGPAGQRGANGPGGADGNDGQDGVKLFAQVTAAGTLDQNKGAVSAKRTFQGQYEVKFNRTVRGQCVPVVSGFDDDALSSPAPGGINANDGRSLGQAAPADTFFVGTRNAAGALTDRGFVIAVYCQ